MIKKLPYEYVGMTEIQEVFTKVHKLIEKGYGYDASVTLCNLGYECLSCTLKQSGTGEAFTKLIKVNDMKPKGESEDLKTYHEFIAIIDSILAKDAKEFLLSMSESLHIGSE